MEYKRGKLPASLGYRTDWQCQVVSMGHCVNKSFVKFLQCKKYIRDPVTNVPPILSQNHNQNSKENQ